MTTTAPKTETLHRTKAAEKLLHSRGFVGVEFVKKDGSTRQMLCYRPKPKLEPKRSSPAHSDNPYLLMVDTVLYKKQLVTGLKPQDAQDKSYRLINLATLREIRLRGTVYRIVD